MTDNKLYTPEYEALKSSSPEELKSLSVKRLRELAPNLYDYWNMSESPLCSETSSLLFAAGYAALAEAREGSLRTPTAPQIAERIACQLDVDEPGTSPETHAYNVRWITAIIKSARGEAHPAPPTDFHKYLRHLDDCGIHSRPNYNGSYICTCGLEEKLTFLLALKLRESEAQPAPQPTPHERYVNLDPPQGAFTITPADPPISGTLTPGAAESSAQPTLIETLGQTAPGAVTWGPVAAEATAQFTNTKKRSDYWNWKTLEKELKD